MYGVGGVGFVSQLGGVDKLVWFPRRIIRKAFKGNRSKSLSCLHIFTPWKDIFTPWKVIFMSLSPKNMSVRWKNMSLRDMQASASEIFMSLSEICHWFKDLKCLFFYSFLICIAINFKKPKKFMALPTLFRAHHWNINSTHSNILSRSVCAYWLSATQWACPNSALWRNRGSLFVVLPVYACLSHSGCSVHTYSIPTHVIWCINMVQSHSHPPKFTH